MPPHPLLPPVLSGDRLALARLLSQVENDTPEGRTALNELFPFAGRAHRIGVTGAPGTGKSSLVNQLARYYRKPSTGETPPRVAIVAIDPTSPFTGGAILGDRVRMRDLAGDPGIFIRSMASRGSLGGLAATTSGIVQIFDAAGFDIILIETVGAGQTEVDIARLAHTTLVVEAPGQGDDIQAIKAGILEIADILVVNKADREGVQSTINALHAMLDLGAAPRGMLHHGVLMTTDGPPLKSDSRWRPPILKTIAAEGKGVDELMDAVAQHRAYLQDHPEGQQRVKVRAAVELETILRETLLRRLIEAVGSDRLGSLIDRVAAREIDPYSAAELLSKTP
jgi:LAO/AO transport system kinase